MDEFRKEFVLICRVTHKEMTNENQIQRAYAAWRLLCCEINDIPKEWYK